MDQSGIRKRAPSTKVRLHKEAQHITCLSFSGIDGAGKSTQIEALHSSLLQRGLRVRVITFWDEVARLTWLRENAGHKILKGEKGVGTPSAPVERRDKNVRSLPMTCFRLFLYLLDAFSLRRMHDQLLSSEFDVIIFDRYIYDELANLNLRNFLIRAYVRMLLKLTPAPELSLLLDADPVQARARKPEYPLDFIHINRKSYHDLCHLTGGIRCIAPMSIDSAHQAILGSVLDALSSTTGSDGSSGKVRHKNARPGQAAC
jgi:thymidylate kinase